MEDRYLFRGKRIDNGEWVEGSYVYCFGKNPFHVVTNINTDNFFIVEVNGTITEVDKSTICQCTGIKDKNGRLIYENDILEAHLDDKFPEDVTRVKVIWDKNAWVTNETGSVDRECLDDFDSKYFEIIGNKIDNPELLEVQE